MKLKDDQRVADGGADRCRADEADLQTLLRAWVGDPDRYAEEALVKLPEKERVYGAAWSERLGAWGRHHSTMASSASSARFTESDWSKVASSVTASASAIASHWMKAYEDAARTCERLAKVTKHDDIAKAIADLTNYRATSKQTYRAVEADYRTWLVEIEVMHELVAAVEAVHGILVCEEDEQIGQELYLVTHLRDDVPTYARWREIDRSSYQRFQIGRRYVLFPRWGTYLRRDHVETVGGRGRIAEVVKPAAMRDVGDLLFVQLTESPAIHDEAKQAAFTELLPPVWQP